MIIFFIIKSILTIQTIEKETSNVIITQREMLADHCNAPEKDMTGKGAER